MSVLLILKLLLFLVTLITVTTGKEKGWLRHDYITTWKKDRTWQVSLWEERLLDMKQANEKCTRRKVIETQEDYILGTSSVLQKNYSNSVMSSSSWNLLEVNLFRYLFSFCPLYKTGNCVTKRDSHVHEVLRFYEKRVTQLTSHTVLCTSSWSSSYLLRSQDMFICPFCFVWKLFFHHCSCASLFSWQSLSRKNLYRNHLFSQTLRSPSLSLLLANRHLHSKKDISFPFLIFTLG